MSPSSLKSVGKLIWLCTVAMHSWSFQNGKVCVMHFAQGTVVFVMLFSMPPILVMCFHPTINPLPPRFPGFPRAYGHTRRCYWAQ